MSIGALAVFIAQIAVTEDPDLLGRLRTTFDPPERIEIVLDLSGSMSLPVSDIAPPRSRLAYVQDELGRYLTALPDRTLVSLRVFGTTPGCDASTQLVPAAPLDDAGRTALLTQVRALRPVGATPLARALREAGASLGTAPGTILLLSDGSDSCEGADAVCSAAREIAVRSGGHLRVDLVRLFLGPAERAALACVPQATGGRLLDLDRAVDGGLTLRLFDLVPLRVGIALLVILMGLLTLLGASDLLAAALGRGLRPGIAGLLAELAFVAAATAWVLFWTRPLLALPVPLQILLALLGIALLAFRFARYLYARQSVRVTPAVRPYAPVSNVELP